MHRFLGSALVVGMLVVSHGCGYDGGGGDSGVDGAVVPDAPPWTEAAREIMTPYVEAGWVPGFSIVVWNDGEAEFLGLGRVDPAVDAPPMPDTLYEIGSITKTFTATLLALAVERGEVSLSDPVSGLVPAGVTVPTLPDAEPIRLEHLVTHTSGLPSNAPSSIVPHAPGGVYVRAIDADTLYADVNSVSLLHSPGSDFLYSNFGGGWLGYELQRLAGEATYDDALRPRVTEPLGMVDTVVSPSAEQALRLAPTLSAPDAPAAPTVLDALDGAVSLRSTASDLARWIGAQVEPPEGELGDSIRATQEPRVEFGLGGAFNGVGMFWLTKRWIDGDLLMHAGITHGGVAMLLLDPNARVGVAILTNSRPITLYTFALALFEEVRGVSWRSLGFAWPTPVPAIEVPPGTFEELAGSYTRADVTLDLVVSDGRLYANFVGPDIIANYIRLWPDASDGYHTRDLDLYVRIEVDREGSTVTGVRWLQDAEYAFTREPTP